MQRLFPQFECRMIGQTRLESSPGISMPADSISDAVDIYGQNEFDRPPRRYRLSRIPLLIVGVLLQAASPMLGAGLGVWMYNELVPEPPLPPTSLERNLSDYQQEWARFEVQQFSRLRGEGRAVRAGAFLGFLMIAVVYWPVWSAWTRIPVNYDSAPTLAHNAARNRLHPTARDRPVAIQDCGNCGVRVIPKRDGRCPSCQHSGVD